MFNWIDDGCLITFSDVVCFLWYFPLCNWGICLLNCSHRFCQSPMPSCISSCLFPSQSSHLPTSSLPACCLGYLCSVILCHTSGADQGNSIFSRFSAQCGAEGMRDLLLCAEQAAFSPLLVLRPALPHPGRAAWYLGWWLSPGCPALSLRAVAQPCSHVTAPEGAPGAACLHSSPCLLAPGMSLGSAATCICSTDCNRSFHWRH